MSILQTCDVIIKYVSYAWNTVTGTASTLLISRRKSLGTRCAAEGTGMFQQCVWLTCQDVGQPQLLIASCACSVFKHQVWHQLHFRQVPYTLKPHFHSLQSSLRAVLRITRNHAGKVLGKGTRYFRRLSVTLAISETVIISTRNYETVKEDKSTASALDELLESQRNVRGRDQETQN